MTLNHPAPLDDPLALPTLPDDGSAFDAVVRPPGSKSLTNRLLLLAALGEGESVLRGAVVDADDAQRMIEAVRRLGASVRVERDGAGGEATVVVEGVGGAWEPAGPTEDGAVRLDLNNAGTATRFLAAAAILNEPGRPPIVIDGNARMRERPIGSLVDMLRGLGARIEYLGREGYPPVKVYPLATCARAGSMPELNVPETLSSQYISALMLTAPFMPAGLALRYAAAPTSPSYVEMTARVLRRVGVSVEGGERLTGKDAAGSMIRISPASLDGGEMAGPLACLLPPFEMDVEPDASGATYFLAAAAVTPGARVAVPGLSIDSLQGDAAFACVLERMGARVERGEFKSGAGEGHCAEPFVAITGGRSLHGIETDFSLMPDAAMTLAAVACFADGPTTIWGLRTLRVKETDRIRALEIELSKIGARVEVLTRRGSNGGPSVDEGVRITPPPTHTAPPDGQAAPEPVVFDTYDDHRMAMSLAVVGLRRAGCGVRDPGCVGKTYPSFWRDWSAMLASR